MKNDGMEPFIELCSPLSPRQSEDSESNFAEDDWIDDDLSLVVPEPVDDTFFPR